jgi:mono/diheme cytochrome c family protein
MKRRKVVSTLAILAGTAGFGIAADAADGVDMGRYEYEAHCIACHGTDGKGDGPFAEQLKTRVPDLTTLSRTNGGVFPHQRVYRVIDGRETVKAHGPRDMPIWGQDYLDKAETAFFGYGLSREGFVRSRILALIDYLHRLQAE